MLNYQRAILILVFCLLIALPAKAQDVTAQFTCPDIFYPADTASKLVSSILAANDDTACSGPDVIDLGGSTVTLTSAYTSYTIGPAGLPRIASDITLQNGTIERSVNTSDFRLLYAIQDSVLTLNNMQLRNGRTSSTGSTTGGMLYNASLRTTINNSRIENNSATTLGGAIVNKGNLAIIDTQLIGNSAGTRGGAIVNKGNLAITDTQFIGNSAGTRGGVIYNDQGVNLVVTGSLFRGNQAEDGGVIFNWGRASVSNSTFERNTATDKGGAIFMFSASGFGGETNIMDTAFIKNTAATIGGAIYNEATQDSVLLINTQLSGNEADSGAAFYANTISDSVIINSIIDGNRAASDGGGIYVESYLNMVITNSTISGNAAGANGSAIYQQAGTLKLQNSILWGNGGPDPFYIFDPKAATSDFFDSIVQGGAPQFDDTSSGVIDADPRFANPLPASASPTINGDYRVLQGSPAVDAGNNNAELDLDTGTSYAISEIGADIGGAPRIQNGTINLGAYESVVGTGLDTNLDGRITPADMLYVVNRVNTSDTTADMDEDGDVDMNDVTIVQKALGTSP